MSFALDAFDDGVAVTVDDHVEDQRPATDGAILDELLPASRRRVDADGVFFVARGAGVESVRFNRHPMTFVRCR